MLWYGLDRFRRDRLRMRSHLLGEAENQEVMIKRQNDLCGFGLSAICLPNQVCFSIGLRFRLIIAKPGILLISREKTEADASVRHDHLFNLVNQ